MGTSCAISGDGHVLLDCALPPNPLTPLLVLCDDDDDGEVDVAVSLDDDDSNDDDEDALAMGAAKVVLFLCTRYCALMHAYCSAA